MKNVGGVPARSVEYFAVHHSVNRAVDAYEAVFARLGAASGARTGLSAPGETEREWM
jgi:hypothetical protein